MKKTEKSHIYRYNNSYLTFCGIEDSSRLIHLESCQGYPCTCTTVVDCEDCKAGQARKRQSQADAAKVALKARQEREAAIPTGFEIYD